jgi:CBS domain-containing protein
MSAQPSPTSRPAGRLARSDVRSAMQLGLFHVGPEDDIAAVARTMAEQSIHSVVVSGIVRRDHAGEHLTWGIVSDLDLMRALRAGADDATAAQVAGSEIVIVSPHDTLAEAVQLMAEHDTAHLVVASPETGRPVGMLSTLDIARALDAG